MFGLAKKYKGEVKVAELNVQRGLRTARNLGVRGTPTVLYFRGGAEVDRVTGFRGQAYHEDVIEEDLLERGGAAAEVRA
jgi:thioredoxin 1